MSRRADRQIRIQIVNPLDRSSTSLFHAKRYVNAGLAKWVGNAIEFLRNPFDHRETSAQRACQVAYDRAASSGIADMDAVRHLPVAGPPIRIFTDRANTRARAPRGRSGPVRVVMAAGVVVA